MPEALQQALEKMRPLKCTNAYADMFGFVAHRKNVEIRNFTPDLIASLHGETRRNRTLPRPTENLASRQKVVFLRVHGMRLHFHDKLAGQRKDPLQASGRFKRRKREEVLHKTEAPGQEKVCKFSE